MSDRIYIGHEEFAEELALGEANGYLTLLPEGSLVISKENGEWPAVAVDWPYEVIVALRHNWTDEGIALIHQQLTRSILDALAEGVPVGADK